ncbi:unnamed protein product [Rhizophagus irregularis]|nr:unnamed protein product [Rhizophagus irregularis]
MYGKCSKTDLIINSGSDLTSKVIGPFSGFEFITSDSCTSVSCHGSFPIFGGHQFEKKIKNFFRWKAV